MDTLRLGFIGTGGIAHLHAGQMLALPQVEIAAVSDPNEQAASRFVSAFGLESAGVFGDHRNMLREVGLDAVIVCSPHTQHFAQAMDALNAGCHVLIEKPMTCCSAEAEQLIQAATNRARLLQVSYQRHFQPEFLYIRKAIADGAIGKLTSVNATLYQDWKLSQAGTWRQNAALSGGGMLMDSGSHIIDVLLWTTGLTPLEVKSTLSTHGAPVEIDSFTSIRFEEGTVASLNVIGNVPGYREYYSFCGELGVIYLDNGRLELITYKDGAIEVRLPERTTNQDKSFVDAIRGEHEVLVSGEYASKVIQLTEAIYRSANYPVENTGE
ncbi:Gfo/Idh/MocA family protein [Paenibacillus harenae]|uniref:Gfo/Idh/MocA family protein n=1 Tax=Paenibacillus harenae TaxID=306543 RepID=UPI00278F5BC4|nr:Gfo/Idh/MocA family oxidoreductase [Paenibacillus harenae]MDQ0059304.1 putative dehydrogenase [Paenibacillus harenae]